MTFRTFDIDAGYAPESADISAPTRTVRRRRRALALTSRASGVRISGFGF